MDITSQLPMTNSRDLAATSWDGQILGQAGSSGDVMQAAVTSQLATQQRAALAVIHKPAEGTGLATCHTHACDSLSALHNVLLM